MTRSSGGPLTLAALLLFGVGLTTSWVMTPDASTPSIQGTTILAAQPPITTAPPPTEPSPTGTLPATTSTGKPPTKPTTAETTTTVLVVSGGPLVTATNEIRASVGVDPLVPDPTLMAYAQLWAVHMAASGGIGHSDIESLLDGWTVVGENVGTGPDPASVMVDLSESGSHYDVMVNAEFEEIGIGVAVDEAGDAWVCQVFGGTPDPEVTVPVETTLPTLPVETTIPDVTLPEVTTTLP